VKGPRHSEEQIIAILKQGEAGLATGELCRQHGISAQTYYRWKAKYAGMESAEVKKLRQLEDENRKLKLLEPAGLRAAVSYAEMEYEMSERHACRLVGLA